MPTVRLQPISTDGYAVPQGSAGSAITQGPTPRLVLGRSVGDDQHTGTGYASYAQVDRVSRVVGSTINYQKSTPWPACHMAYLGLSLDTGPCAQHCLRRGG